jgi:hypothetical protein
MKYILRVLLLTAAFIIVAPFVAIYCLWEFEFSAVKQLYLDYLDTVHWAYKPLMDRKFKSTQYEKDSSAH